MARQPGQRYAPQVEAKIIKHGRDRYFVARYPRKPSPGYSYHWWLIEGRDKLKKQVIRQVVKKILDLPHASDNDIAKFYDALFERTVDIAKVKELRAKSKR